MRFFLEKIIPERPVSLDDGQETCTKKENRIPHFPLTSALRQKGAIMTKAELIAKIAEQASISKSSAEQSLNALLEAIQEALASDGKLSLPGFGSLVVEERKERKGHNPRTGETITIPAGMVVKFRAGINLKKQIQ